MRAAAWKCCIISLYQPNIKEKFATGAGVVLGGHMRAAARKDGFRLESELLQLQLHLPNPDKSAEIFSNTKLNIPLNFDLPFWFYDQVTSSDQDSTVPTSVFNLKSMLKECIFVV